jgi:hypothetical protein
MGSSDRDIEFAEGLFMMISSFYFLRVLSVSAVSHTKA